MWLITPSTDGIRIYLLDKNYCEKDFKLVYKLNLHSLNLRLTIKQRINNFLFKASRLLLGLNSNIYRLQKLPNGLHLFDILYLYYRACIDNINRII